MPALGADRERPERGARSWIIERTLMVDPHDGADHIAGLHVFCHQQRHHPSVTARPEILFWNRHHAMLSIDCIDRFRVSAARQTPDMEAAPDLPRGPVGCKV